MKVVGALVTTIVLAAGGVVVWEAVRGPAPETVAGGGQGGTAAVAPFGGAPGGAPGAGAAVTTPPTTAAVASSARATTPSSGWIATLPAATAYAARAGGPAVGVLPATNPYGVAETVAVIGAPTGEWLHVELPIRPNGSTGWIPARAARLTWTPYTIEVSLAARTLTLRKGSQVVLASPVAVGTPRTPTPPDHTYVWELIQPPNPAGDYGPYIFGLAEFSDSYSVFNGGDVQIGIHGTDEPASIGQPASHGCVRLPNAVLRQLVGVLPLGTPVTIS